MKSIKPDRSTPNAPPPPQQSLTRNTCIAEPREAWGGEAHKMSGMEGGENWSKVGSLGGRVSTLALILEGEICS